MEKILTSIRQRYSSVLFSEKKVETEKIDLLLEAARWAPSSYNEQPWRFIVAAKGDETFRYFKESLMEGNIEWNKTVPLYMLSLSKKNFSKNNKVNKFAAYDTGMAVGNMLAQAVELGLNIHQMGGFDAHLLRNKLGINDEFEIHALMAIGYTSEEMHFSENLISREQMKRSRKEAKDLLL